MKNILQEIKDCSSVRINCCLCGAGERVYFIPESIISKLEVVVAKMETTTPTATCKDSLQVGNAAKMREVLDEIRVAAMSDYEWDADYLIEKCNAALSAPPRNCDMSEVAKGKPIDLAEQAWRVFKRSHKDSYLDAYGLLRCIGWLLTEAKGEVK